MARRKPTGGVVVALGAAVAVVLALDGLALVQAGRSRDAPTFSQGGAFLAPPDGTTTTTPPTTSDVPSTSVPIEASSTTTPTTDGAPEPTTTVTAPPEAGFKPPTPGTYVYAVTGTETASVVGSRPFAPRMTMVVHGAPGLGSGQVVMDYSFSAEHEERDIAHYGSDGVSLVHEGGSITFGLVTESSDVSLDPPMGLVPFPLVVGTARSGTSTARSSAGAVARVDDWETRAVGTETVVAAGRPVETAGSAILPEEPPRRRGGHPANDALDRSRPEAGSENRG
jgi:hypothetical protein